MTSTHASALACALLLAACDPSLPDGNYKAEDLRIGTGAEDAAVRDDVPVDDTPTRRDASTPTDAATAEEQKLRALTGLYFVRMDMFSSSTVTPLPTLSVKARSRVSHLLVTNLFVAEDGKLKAEEKLCHQTFEHRCTNNNCRTLTTTMHPNVTNHTRRFPRRYALQGDTITAEKLSMYLGFDSDQDSSMPQSSSDPRVWDVVASTPGREGLMVRLDFEGPLAQRHCDVYTAQRFTSAFGGKLANGTSLLNTTFALEVVRSPDDSKALGASESDCEGDGNGSVTPEGASVRFAKAELDEAALWRCPDASAWDKAGLVGAAP